MAITRYDFFYDEQVKRYLMQVVRAFSGFQYMTGARGDSPPQVRLVPCKPASRNRQVAAIQRNMSENTLLSVPMITVDITNFEPDRERMQNPSHISTVQMTERAKDEITGEYTNGRGNSVTIDRLMPPAFLLSIQVDIWTSNLEQKMMLLEQIDTVMYPGFDIQNSDNPLDWSALTTATFESQVYSSLSIPIGTENDIDVCTINLKIPMWLTPPAKVTRQNIIQQVITNIKDGQKDDKGVLIPTAHMASVVTTPGNNNLRLEKGMLTLLGPSGQEFSENGQPYSWESLLGQYSDVIRSGETLIRLRSVLGDDTKNDVVGVVFSTNEPNILAWQPDIDTLPVNTLGAIDAVINPLVAFPGEGSMPDATEGQRYLLIEDLAGFPGNNTPPIGSPQTAWSGIQARAGSIIQYQDRKWRVSFNATNHQKVEFVTNRHTGRQLAWSVDEQSWVMALDAIYGPGYWRIGL